MNIFLSWSGPTSQAVATELREWLPQVINDAKPWISSEDIRKGSRWSSEIAGQLSQAKLGIVCLTATNTLSPWLLFEAGAISKVVDRARVCTYLFGLKATDVPDGPLTQFQATLADRGDTRKLVQTVNESLDSPLADNRLEKAFDKWWPELKDKFDLIAKSHFEEQANTQPRTQNEIVEEILLLVRQMSRQIETNPGLFSSFDYLNALSGEQVPSSLKSYLAENAHSLQSSEAPQHGQPKRGRSLYGQKYRAKE